MRLARRRQALALGVAGIVAGTLFGPSLASAGVETFKDVVVRNTESQPVPTKAVGTSAVEVQGTPKVSLDGTPKVSLDGVPKVSVDGTPTVELADADVVQRRVEFNVKADSGNCERVQLPEDRVVTVQALHASFWGPAPDEGTVSLEAQFKLPADPSGLSSSQPVSPATLERYSDIRWIGSVSTLLRVVPDDQAQVGEVIAVSVCANSHAATGGSIQAIVVGQAH